MRIIIIIICWLFSTGIFAQSPKNNLEISHLTGDFYIFQTFNLYKGERIPANGMYLITNNGAVLFDTPWDSTQFQPLLDSIKTKHHKNVTMCIATHFHDDRTGGLEYYRLQGIKTYTTMQTDELSKQRGKKRAELLIDKDTVFNEGQYSFQTYYAGPGHSPDNIIIWFGKEKIIYGGCLIKSVEDTDLGYLGDANVHAWGNTIKNIQRKCKDPKFIIPGHDSWASKKSLDHTLKLVLKAREKSSH